MLHTSAKCSASDDLSYRALFTTQSICTGAFLKGFNTALVMHAYSEMYSSTYKRKVYNIRLVGCQLF